MVTAMKIDPEKSFLLVVRQFLDTAELFLYGFFHCSYFLCVFVSKQHPVKHAKGRAKLDGVLVAEVTSGTAGEYRQFTGDTHYPESETPAHGVARSALSADCPRSALEKIQAMNNQN